MRVEIDSHSGFCFGVVRAISRAEEALQEQGEVFSLGTSYTTASKCSGSNGSACTR